MRRILSLDNDSNVFRRNYVNQHFRGCERETGAPAGILGAR